MAYTKTVWTARQGTNLNKFTKSAEVGNTFLLTNTPDAITQAGMPFSVENMNKLEQGIFDAHATIDSLLDQDSFGYGKHFYFEPSAYQLATWRFLPMQGQVILISQYQRLCNVMYAGDALNATADWWYKTSNPEGTIRDVNGAYMRVLDHRGVASRAAGQNSKYRMANDTPYDGGAIGQHLPDAVEQHGHINIFIGDERNLWLANGTGAAYKLDLISGGGSDNYYTGVVTGSNAQSQVRVAEETRMATIASYYCMKY
jgi:hypothetical protein